MSLQPHALVAVATLVQVALRVGSLRCTVKQRLFSFVFDIAIQSSSADGSELVDGGLRRPRPFSHLGHELIFFSAGSRACPEFKAARRAVCWTSPVAVNVVCRYSELNGNRLMEVPLETAARKLVWRVTLLSEHPFRRVRALDKQN